MNGLDRARVIGGNSALGILWFAKQPDQEMEFDEGLEDDDALRPKPPSRRPLIWLLLLLVVVGGVYWLLQPDTSMQSRERQPAITKPSSESTTIPSSAPAPSKPAAPPSPAFHEGQQAVIVPPKDGRQQAVRLFSDPEGSKPGPQLKAGETVIIVDGALVDQQWVYQVRTPSGATGWVQESMLTTRS
ncbi:MAG: SH3 domain-containing protein [Nitrospirae bacterium]|nr:MAG: SH3 domain-containing protein [Nitrospirota bacterium]